METKKYFRTSLAEKILAILIFPLSYLYVQMIFCMDVEGSVTVKILFALFVLGFVAFNEVLQFRKKRSVESIIWLACSAVFLVCFCFDIGHVWDEECYFLFLHLFAVYYAMTRAHALSDDETSKMCVWDGITAFFVLPFKNFILAVRTIISCFTGNGDPESRKDGIKVLVTIASCILALILLVIMIALLRSADKNFDALFQTIFSGLGFEFSFETVLKIYFTLIVGCYLYGMIGGLHRETRAHFTGRAHNIMRFVEKLAKMPSVVWMIIIAVFSVFYIVFFAMQGSYMFGAFANRLERGYTYAAYAKSGFGQMCGVMIVNFILLWLALYTSNKRSSGLKAVSAVLLSESILFAVIAASKLFMYIRVYGFTPLRLQGVWLIVILVSGCVCTLVHLFSGKKTCRIWFISSALLLTALSFV